MTAWQPIETAPRDGSEILAETPNGIEIVSWVDRAEHAPDQPGHEAGWASRDHHLVCPAIKDAGRYDREASNQPTLWTSMPAASMHLDHLRAAATELYDALVVAAALYTPIKLDTPDLALDDKYHWESAPSAYVEGIHKIRAALLKVAS